MLTMSGLPAIMQIAIENSIPVFHSTAETINLGATVSAGTAEYARQGNLIGAMLAGHLSGELDIASTGIALVDQLNVGLNLDSASAQGIKISSALMDRASVLLRDGRLVDQGVTELLAAVGMDEETIKVVVEALQHALVGGGQTELDLPDDVMAKVTALLASQRRMDDVSAILDSLHCTPEMIAEQQAALEAAE